MQLRKESLKKKSGLKGFEPWPLRHRCCALAKQLSSQASWELVIKLVRNRPGKGEDEMMNMWILYIWTAGWRNKYRDDHHHQEPLWLLSQLMQLGKDSLKKLQACRDSNPDLCDTGGKDVDEMMNMWIFGNDLSRNHALCNAGTKG